MLQNLKKNSWMRWKSWHTDKGKNTDLIIVVETASVKQQRINSDDDIQKSCDSHYQNSSKST